MSAELKILLVEDSPQDVELVLLHLKKQGLNTRHEVVDSAQAMTRALNEDWDVILCDYNLPSFGALQAISITKSTKPDIPIVVVSGSVGEERAVETMQAGASDFVMKDNLLRLVPAIERGLKERSFHLESHRIEADLKKAEADLRQAQKLEAIGQLAGGVAHDFNNIVATILMQVEILLDEKTQETPDKRVAQLEAGILCIKDAAERAKSLTRQLLGFSRKQVLQPKVLHLNSLLARMTAMLRPIVEANIEFRHAFADDLKNIKADPGHIEQILLNLVVNSRDAMPEGGQLTISTRNGLVDERMALQYGVSAGSYAVLEVKDTGCGISPEAQKRLFEPFFTTKPVGKGTGLGLCTIYGIVKQNRGLIFVSSITGKGTTFQIYLPQVNEAVDTSAAPAAAAIQVFGNETILLVEDEDSLRNIVATSLRKKGYKILEAANGIDALERLQASTDPIDLVITDIVMPQMGGVQLAEECEKLKKKTKFLFQSGYTENVLVESGIRSGKIHFLEKPYSSKALLEKIRGILDLRALAILCALSFSTTLRAEPPSSLEERVQKLEQNQEDMFHQVMERRGDVKSFLGDDILLGGYFESGMVLIGGGDTRTQAAASSHSLGINLTAIFNNQLRFNSQLLTGLSFPLQNPNHTPRGTLVGLTTKRKFGSAAVALLLAQGYVEYSNSSSFIVQTGLGYAPFGIAFQQRDPVLFRRRGGPQLLGGSASDTLGLAAPLWMGAHLSGSKELGSGRWGYNLYSFTPTSKPETPGGGARLWLAPLSDSLTIGTSSQAGKRGDGKTFKVLGFDAKWKYKRFGLATEYIRNYTKSFNPWSAYIEPEFSFADGEFLVYGAVDYFNNTMGVVANATRNLSDPYQQLRYGGGVNWLPSAHTRFRIGYMWYDYLGTTAVVSNQNRDFYSLDLSAGVAF